MANRRTPQSFHDFPTWARTAGAARDAGTLVQVSCRICKAQRSADLDRVIAAKGEDYSLVDRNPRCNLTAGCNGRLRLSYRGHGCMRNLETDRFVEWMAERDWQARRFTAQAIKDGGREREEKKMRERR